MLKLRCFKLINLRGLMPGVRSVCSQEFISSRKLGLFSLQALRNATITRRNYTLPQAFRINVQCLLVLNITFFCFSFRELLESLFGRIIIGTLSREYMHFITGTFSYAPLFCVQKLHGSDDNRNIFSLDRRQRGIQHMLLELNLVLSFNKEGSNGYAVCSLRVYVDTLSLLSFWNWNSWRGCVWLKNSSQFFRLDFQYYRNVM